MLLLALPATSAWANAADDRIIADCQDSPTGALRGSYPQKQLNHALHNLPGDIREYTGCSGRDQTGAARQRRRRRDGGGSDGRAATAAAAAAAIGGSGSAAAAAAAQPDERMRARRRSPTRRRRPAPNVRSTWPAPPSPRARCRRSGSDSHRLPTPLLVLLVLLGVAALVPAALTIGRRVVGHRGA